MPAPLWASRIAYLLGSVLLIIEAVNYQVPMAIIVGCICIGGAVFSTLERSGHQ